MITKTKAKSTASSWWSERHKILANVVESKPKRPKAKRLAKKVEVRKARAKKPTKAKKSTMPKKTIKPKRVIKVKKVTKKVTRMKKAAKAKKPVSKKTTKKSK